MKKTVTNQNHTEPKLLFETGHCIIGSIQLIRILIDLQIWSGPVCTLHTLHMANLLLKTLVVLRLLIKNINIWTLFSLKPSGDCPTCRASYEVYTTLRNLNICSVELTNRCRRAFDKRQHQIPPIISTRVNSSKSLSHTRGVNYQIWNSCQSLMLYQLSLVPVYGTFRPFGINHCNYVTISLNMTSMLWLSLSHGYAMMTCHHWRKYTFRLFIFEHSETNRY